MTWLIKALSDCVLGVVTLIASLFIDQLITPLSLNPKYFLAFFGEILPSYFWVIVGLAFLLSFIFAGYAILKGIANPAQAPSPSRVLFRMVLSWVMIVFVTTALCSIIGYSQNVILFNNFSLSTIFDDLKINYGSETIQAFSPSDVLGGDDGVNLFFTSAADANSDSENSIYNIVREKYSDENILIQIFQGLGINLPEIVAAIIAIFVVIAIGFSLVKYLFEIVERYLMMFILIFLSPLPAATLADPECDTFGKYMQMFFSTVMIYFLNMVFLKIIMSGMNLMYGKASDQAAIAGLYLLQCVLVYALIHIAQSLDTFMGSFFLTFKTQGALGSNLWSTVTGLNSMKNMAKDGFNTLKKAPSVARGVDGALKAAGEATQGENNSLLSIGKAMKNGYKQGSQGLNNSSKENKTSSAQKENKLVKNMSDAGNRIKNAQSANDIGKAARVSANHAAKMDSAWAQKLSNNPQFEDKNGKLTKEGKEAYGAHLSSSLENMAQEYGSDKIGDDEKAGIMDRMNEVASELGENDRNALLDTYDYNSSNDAWSQESKDALGSAVSSAMGNPNMEMGDVSRDNGGNINGFDVKVGGETIQAKAPSGKSSNSKTPNNYVKDSRGYVYDLGDNTNATLLNNMAGVQNGSTMTTGTKSYGMFNGDYTPLQSDLGTSAISAQRLENAFGDIKTYSVDDSGNIKLGYVNSKDGSKGNINIQAVKNDAESISQFEKDHDGKQYVKIDNARKNSGNVIRYAVRD